jgi:hypothetical protein
MFRCICITYIDTDMYYATTKINLSLNKSIYFILNKIIVNMSYSHYAIICKDNKYLLCNKMDLIFTEM